MSSIHKIYISEKEYLDEERKALNKSEYYKGEYLQWRELQRLIIKFLKGKIVPFYQAISWFINKRKDRKYSYQRYRF